MSAPIAGTLRRALATVSLATIALGYLACSSSRQFDGQRVNGRPAKAGGEETGVAGKDLPQEIAAATVAREGDAFSSVAGAVNAEIKPYASPTDREQYSRIYDNAFLSPRANPLSTFSIDVDAASYSNIRRFLTSGQAPPADAVRIEEMINYFHYEYPEPEGPHPFSVVTEMADAPWNARHKLILIGLQGRHIQRENLPPSNLVFLLDVSGSMDEPDKLPLLKSAFRLLVQQLRPQDRVAIVVYAGAAGLVLPSTPGSERDSILAALDCLQAGGSTAGGAGIQLAYRVAKENLIPGGNNRVILATDGDFNVGVSSDAELIRMIEEKRTEGAFLTVLGFGTGNLQDARMEQLADKGNGNYAYVDNINEARKVFVHELGGTLVTIAKDVKLQVEFNPAQVAAYRLIGYENRVLQSEDFNDDTKDAGELGAGHSVTALYEIVPAGQELDVTVGGIDSLKYQALPAPQSGAQSAELLTVKLRYKRPNEDSSRLLSQVLNARHEQGGANLGWASAVAGFGMVLRGSEYRGSADANLVLRLAREWRGDDEQGYRAEFVSLVEKYRDLRTTAMRE
ncbi:MAG: VWA domain-containing protein [Gemmatimonadota bacterium]